VLQRVITPQGVKIVEAWVPPKFGDGQEPYDGGLLPFTSRYTPSLADCYFVLALVHNADRRGPGRINPFPPDDEEAIRFYYAQLAHVSHLSASDQLTLDDCLARVEADAPVDPVSSTPLPPSAPQRPLAPPGRAKPAHAAAPPLTATEQEVLTIIKKQSKGKGIQGKAIIAALKKKGIDLKETTLRKHILPKLQRFHGVENIRAAGGYLIPVPEADIPFSQ
jgi:hypothetical protein